jgi:hypothetical protein
MITPLPTFNTLKETLTHWMNSKNRCAWIDLRDILTPFVAPGTPMELLSRDITNSIAMYKVMDSKKHTARYPGAKQITENSGAEVKDDCIVLSYALAGPVELRAIVYLSQINGEITGINKIKVTLHGMTEPYIETMHRPGTVMVIPDYYGPHREMGMTSVTCEEIVPALTAPKVVKKQPIRITIEGPSASGKSTVMSVLARALSGHGILDAVYDGFDENPAAFYAKAHNKEVAVMLSKCSIHATEVMGVRRRSDGTVEFQKEALERERLETITMREHDIHKAVLGRSLRDLLERSQALGYVMHAIRNLRGLDSTVVADGSLSKRKEAIHSEESFRDMEVIFLGEDSFVIMQYGEGEVSNKSSISVMFEVRPMVAGTGGVSVDFSVVHVKFSTANFGVMTTDFVLSGCNLKLTRNGFASSYDVFDAEKLMKLIVSKN